MKRILGFILALFVGGYAAAQTTPNINLNIPLPNATNWNVALNQNFNSLDSLISGSIQTNTVSWQYKPLFVNGTPANSTCTVSGTMAYNYVTTPYTTYVCNGAVTGISTGTWQSFGGYGGCSSITNGVSCTGNVVGGAGSSTPTSLSSNGVLYSNGTVQNTAAYIPTNVAIVRPTSTNASGAPNAPPIIVLIGNSLVFADTGIVSEFCNEIAFNSTTGAPGWANGYCRTSTQMSVDSSANVTLTIPNSDGNYQVGTRITAYAGAGVDSGCLFDSYILTGATATTITFNTSTHTSCSSMSPTAESVLVTKSIQKFGENGATLDVWYNDNTPLNSPGYGFTAYSQFMQQQIAAGNYPITIMTDSGIMSNNTRVSGYTYQGFMNDLVPKTKSILGITATVTVGQNAGSVMTVGEFPFYITTGNPNSCQTTTTGTYNGVCSGGSNTGTGGVYVAPSQISGYVQYVFPCGYSGTACSTTPVIASGPITAGVNTVTINPCPPDLNGGPGDVETTVTDANGYLRQNGNLIQMVVDTTGSGVQEMITLTGFQQLSTIGTLGWNECQVTANFAFAHAANAQIVSTEFTADQTWTRWKREIPYDLASLFPNIQVIDSMQSFGTQVINPGFWMANELHPNLNGYGKLGITYLSALTSFQNNPLQPRSQDPLTYESDTGLLTPRLPAPDLTYTPDLEVTARNQVSGSVNGGSFLYSYCLDPLRFYPVEVGGINNSITGFMSIGTPVTSTTYYGSSAQTGDVIWTSGGGCFQPTTLSGRFQATSNVQLVYTGTPTVPIPAYGRVIVERPYYADLNLASQFIGQRAAYPLSSTYSFIVKSTSTTNNLVFTIEPAQNPNVVGGFNLQCSQLSVQQGDWIIFAGQTPGSAPATGTRIQLGAGTWNTSTCTWTDTSATNYSTYSNRQATLIQSARGPDATLSTLNASLESVYTFTANAATSRGGLTVTGTPTPTVYATQNAGTGSLVSGNTYYYKIALQPIGQTCNGPTASTSFTASSGATAVNILMNGNTVPPAGYQYALYGRPATSGGTYGLINTSTSTSIGDNGTATPGAAPSATDTCNIGIIGPQYITGAGGMTFTAGAAAGTSPTLAVKSGHVSDTLSGVLTLTTGTATTTGTLLTATFPAAHTNSANCIWQLFLPGTGGVTTWEPIDSSSAPGITVHAALTASTAYTVTYSCEGN